MDAHEALSIKVTQLNAYTLNVLSGVEVTWTHDVSRHLLLTKAKQDSARHLMGNDRYVLEVFSLPCSLDAITSISVGVSSELVMEIQESYAMLFNAWPVKLLHTRFRIRHFCWCWSCSAIRHRQDCIASCRSVAYASLRRRTGVLTQSDFDPLLEKLVESDSMYAWTQEDFPHLWPRIIRLEHHLLTAKPWSLTVLFRDRRDTVQFWTFL